MTKRKRNDEAFFNEPETVAWARDVLDNMAPKLRSSDFVISLAPSDGSLGDAKLWVELGASIMYDKPVIVVVPHDGPIPEHLERVADEIVRLPAEALAAGPGSAESEALMAAIKRVEDALDAKGSGSA